MEYISKSKINVFLDVVRRHKNGFHSINSLFMQTSFFDVIKYEQNDSGRCTVRTESDLFEPNDNLLTKAYNAYFSFTKRTPIGITFDVEKNIPAGGGLGGGSSNAAAVLTILNKIVYPRLSSSTLMMIAQRVGSDVPYFINGGTQLVMGRGEICRPIAMKKMELYIVMLLPEILISTPMAYRWIDESGLSCNVYENERRFKNIKKAVESGDRELFISNCYNKFEEAVFSHVPELAVIKQEMFDAGLDQVVMSGSGSTMLGFAKTRENLQKAIAKMSKKGYKLREVKLS